MSWYNNNTVSRHVGSYTPKYEWCRGTYIFESKERGHSGINKLWGGSGTVTYTLYKCDTCGNTCKSTMSRLPKEKNKKRNQCSRKYDIADPRGINILCRKEDDGTYSLIWDVHANDSLYPESYLGYHKIKNLKDADEDDVFGTVRKDGQKWITTSPLTEEKFRFKNRTLAITRLRNHLRKERLK
tara:strand:- start:65 stop:616 length:552 start_codon:yes stop_codon:yes gene_type:complete